MNGTGDPARMPVLDFRSSRVRVAAGIVAAVAVVALLGQALLTGPHPSPSGPVAAASPSSRPSVAPSAAPVTLGPTEGMWSDLVVPPYARLADLTPSDVDRIGIATNTTFTLRSLGSTPAVTLAAGLSVLPATRLTIKPGASADVAIVRPATPFVEGQRYRFNLTAPDGSLAGAWAFIARAPLHVVTTLPGDKAIRVPRNTGIEITFDQDGVKGVADHVTIKPAVDGRWEAHGRTFAFVPTQPLAAATIYTLTVRAGIGLDGSDETLEHDAVFRFETAAGSSTEARFDFARPMVEVRPKIAPVMLLTFDDDGDQARPSSVKVDVARLPTLAAAVDAAKHLAGSASWAVASTEAVVSTSGLEHVATVDAAITDSGTGPIMVIPANLAAGRYLLTVAQATGPAQLLLLVTNLATYAVVATESTVVWVNDLSAVSPVRAAVAFADGTSLGRTDADGVLRVATPARLKSTAIADFGEPQTSPAQILTVTGETGGSTLVLLGLPASWGYAGEGPYDPSSVNSRWWTLFQTDRDTYRQTDTIHVWGLVRARADRSVPTDVEIRLRPESSQDGAPIIRNAPTLTSRGTFVADLALIDLPRGAYHVDLVVQGRTIASTWLNVTEIRKPAYRIDVRADHEVYVAGTPAVLTATATFYDGTVVPGMDLRFRAFGHDVTATTNAAGIASVTLDAGWSDQPQPGDASSEQITVGPVHPEEGEIQGDDRAIVVPARLWLSASAAITSGHVVIDGTLIWVDLAAYEAALGSNGWVEVPPGNPAGGRALSATVVRQVVTRTQVGTTYDFVAKKVVPNYEEETREVVVGTYPVTSSSTGAVHLSVAIPDAGDDYRVSITANDPENRSFVRSTWASAPARQVDWWLQAYLAETNAQRAEHGYAVGDTVSMTLHKPDRSVASGGRFLFVVAREGRLVATVQDGGTFVSSFDAADMPGFTVRGVWLTGTGFTIADGTAAIDLETKTLKVTLTPDKSRYEPGDEATIAVRATSPAGAAVVADVIVTALDEKLFTLGQAFDENPIWTLLALPSAGFVQSYVSHQTPWGDGGGMGDGGGGREDFRDSATFQRVTTDASGRASVHFTLPDDLTGWHVTATAVSGQLDAGQASVVLPTGLAFFADAVLAPEFLVGEEPVLRIRGYGEALGAGDVVTFDVTSPDLGVSASASAKAFTAARVQLPALPAGTHRITIAARVTHGSTVLTDTIVRTVNVVSSRLETLATRVDPLVTGFTPTGGDGLTTYLITDAGRGSLIAILEGLASSAGPRFDQAVAADVARQLLIAEFDVDPLRLPPSGYEAAQYEGDGLLALLPYAGSDLVLSSTAALTVPSKVNTSELRARLLDRLDQPETTREQRIQVLAGLAGLGEDVLGQLRSFDWHTLTLREQLWLGLGLAASGDEDGARAIERAILEAQGQRLGRWVRLDAGTGLETSRQATALLLLLASRIGDPLAADVARYLVDQPSTESLVSLELLAYAQSALDRLPRALGTFAFTVDGKRTEVTLRPGGASTLVLTAAQRATLSFERLDGSLEIVTSWTATDAALPADASLTVKRTVSPAGVQDGDGLVKVTLEVTFGPKTPDGCYQLTDLAPSGLSPIISAGHYYVDDELLNGPYAVEGQRVSWCAGPRDQTHVYTYRARVVSPGTYRWEPAILQSAIAPALGASTPASTYRIN